MRIKLSDLGQNKLGRTLMARRWSSGANSAHEHDISTFTTLYKYHGGLGRSHDLEKAWKRAWEEVLGYTREVSSEKHVVSFS